MNTESDYSAMARTNPVFVTAKTAVCLMAQAEIPDAERIVRSLKIENNGGGSKVPHHVFPD